LENHPEKKSPGFAENIAVLSLYSEEAKKPS
jgi:hypothetical protein